MQMWLAIQTSPEPSREITARPNDADKGSRPISPKALPGAGVLERSAFTPCRGVHCAATELAVCTKVLLARR